jgi:hypothetical protein
VVDAPRAPPRTPTPEDGSLLGAESDAEDPLAGDGPPGGAPPNLVLAQQGGTWARLEQGGRELARFLLDSTSVDIALYGALGIIGGAGEPHPGILIGSFVGAGLGAVVGVVRNSLTRHNGVNNERHLIPTLLMGAAAVGPVAVVSALNPSGYMSSRAARLIFTAVEGGLLFSFQIGMACSIGPRGQQA